MSNIPAPIAEFLAGKRIAVAGVSRTGASAGNAVFRKLRDCGYTAIPVNPRAATIENTPCYPDLGSIPGELDGVVVATHPRDAAAIVRQAAARGVRRIWFHRSFGQGSVSDDAVAEAKRANLTTIVGGCPLMYLKPDMGHRCMRAVLAWGRRVPA
jgi:predicted CoA-binding protein